MTSRDFKSPQMTSNESPPSIGTVEPKKNKLKGGAKIEINDEIFHDNNLRMDLAMQIISIDQTKRCDTIEDLKELSSQSSATQAKKGEQFVSMMLAIKKAFDLTRDDIVELSTKSESLKNKIGFYHEKRLEESKAKLLKQIDDEERKKLFTSIIRKQMKK